MADDRDDGFGNGADNGAQDDATDQPEDEYKVGYRKPPKHTQFPKGQSGNPRGRKKGSRGLKTDLNAELNRVLEVKMGSYRFKGTSQQLMLRGLALLAANGNLKASAQLVPLILTVFGTEDRGVDKKALSAHDQAILDNFLAAFGGDTNGELKTAKSTDERKTPTDSDPGSAHANNIDAPAGTECDGEDLP
jgi:hypothetical protein